MTNSLEKITALSFFPLPAAEDPNMALDTLPDIRPTFFVPRLADKPQNPIMDTLYLLNHGRKYPILTDRLPIELEVITNDLQLAVENSHIMQGNLWDYVATQKAAESSCLMSWDRLRSSLNARVSPSAFLSQQTDQVFASARYYVRPSLRDPSLQLVYVTPQELFHSLRITLSGISSPFHIWDPRSEMFVLRGIEEGKKGAMVITGKDEVVCSSFVHRFLTIGTLMRRLDTLVVNHRKSHSRTEPVHHAFMHALSSILAFLRQVAVALPSSMTPDPEILPGDTAALAASWLHYAELEEVLQAFAALCHREQHVTPTAYAKIPSSASQLLTNIYQSLNGHLERRSPRIVNALFAYILTMISRDYFRQVCHSVGYTLNGVSPLDAIQSRRTVDGHQESGLLDEEDEEDQNAVLDEDDVTDNSFPCFFEPYVTDAIVRARRSLQLLLSARPDHPLLNSQLSRRQIKWIWTVDEIEAAWNDDNTTSLKSNIGEQMRIPVDAEEIASTRQQRLYRAELKHFGVFDLAPGSKAAQAASSGPLLNHSAISDLQAFVREFPSSLPLLTPTLSHLTSLILSPLVRHIDSLSSALVSLFLSPSTHLNLRAHLTLLRSYLLLTSHSFKWRLKYALFSDSGDFESARAGTRSFAALNSHSSTRNGQRSKSGESSGRWVVGLSPSLTEGGSWPPGGADLAFQLRTAIVDSLKSIRSPERHDEFWTLEGQERILEEAEHRLGFVLRDLPSGTGKEKWLDPLSIEALDFLYMDYKPPRPLDILVTPVILSKYHRVFAFNIRLMRVESIMGAVFRMTRKPSEPLFPTLSSSNKLLLHFRFVAHSFVSSLSCYVYDTAIGGNFDAFLSKLVPEHGSASATSRSMFADVFFLAECHSKVLDDILSACLLRSGQKAVGNLLRGCLELVLEFGILVGDLKRGRLEEYQAAPLLEDQWNKFRDKVMTLIKVLRALVDKGFGSSLSIVDDVRLQTLTARLAQIEGVTGNLLNLLVRLDVAEWWAQAYEQRSPG